LAQRLIFTQYADSAQYLYENLDPHGARDDVEIIFGISGLDQSFKRA